MTTSDQQGEQPLTRKQLREIRLTGATPVVEQPDAEQAADEPAEAPATPSPPVSASSAPSPASGSVPAVAEPEEPVAGPEPETPDAVSTDADAPERTLTRREIRELEKQRAAAAPSAPPEAEPEEAPTSAPAGEEQTATESQEEESEPASDRGRLSFRERRRAAAEAKREAREAAEAAAVEESAQPPVAPAESPVEHAEEEEEQPVGAAEHAEPSDEPEAAETPPVEVSPLLGKEVLEESSEPPALSPSFDELVAPADSTGSQHISPTALIFNQTPGPLTLSGPLDSTGEVVVTGSYEFPSSVGAHGHAPGTTDGKDIDASLVDSELSASSSPAPVAASSAIGTIKPAGEVMRQPVPEKGSKLLMGLALTAGGLMLALSVALILAFTNGVF